MSVSLTVDGIAVTVAEGTTVAQAATAAGVYLPTLCSHSGHPLLGTCRVCVARVDGRIVAACTIPVADGQVVEVAVEELGTMRRQVVGLLFAEGNHVCPSCEKSGRCDLQAVAAETGMLASEFPYRYPRRETDPGDTRIWLARDRCILCQRCVELVRDAEGRPVFSISGRSSDTRVELDHERADSLSEDQVDAAVALCPVGAILRKGVGYDDPIGDRRYDRASVRERTLGGEPR
jgi:[NiFe] hydrogenase diaphorase moiety small subunit